LGILIEAPLTIEHVWEYIGNQKKIEKKTKSEKNNQKQPRITLGFGWSNNL
jgi:hypothetical protein